MTKTDLVKAVSKKTGYSQKNIKECVDVILETIVEGTRDDGEVNLLGFGRFSAVERPAREYRNPSTGEMFMAEAKKVPKFKISSAFKEAVAGK